MQTNYLVHLPTDRPSDVECESCGDETAVAYGCYENRYGELCEEPLCAECLKERDDEN